MHGCDLVQEPKQRHVDLGRDVEDVEAKIDMRTGVPFQLRSGYVKELVLVPHGNVSHFF